MKVTTCVKGEQDWGVNPQSIEGGNIAKPTNEGLYQEEDWDYLY